MTSALNSLSRSSASCRQNDLRLKVTARKHGSQGRTLALLIVDDENPARNHRLQSICLYSSKPAAEPANQSIQHRLNS